MVVAVQLPVLDCLVISWLVHELVGTVILTPAAGSGPDASHEGPICRMRFCVCRVCSSGASGTGRSYAVASLH